MIDRVQRFRNTRIVRIVALICVLGTLCLSSGCYVYRAFVVQYDHGVVLRDTQLSCVYVNDINESIKLAHDESYLARLGTDTSAINYLSDLKEYPYDKDMWYLNIMLCLHPIHGIDLEKIITDTIRVSFRNNQNMGNSVACLQYYQVSEGYFNLYPIIIPKSHHGPFYIYVVLSVYQKGSEVPIDRIPLTIKCERKTKVRFGD